MNSERLALVSCFLTLCACYAVAPRNALGRQSPSSAPGQQQAAPSAQADASPAQDKKAPPRAKKVYTDDDVKSSGPAVAGEVDLNGINNCDEECRGELLKGLVTPGGWDKERDIARALEGVRGDFEWQAALHAYARYRVRFCELEKERTQSSAKAASIDYKQKEKELGDEMRRDVRTRWSDPSWIGNDVVLKIELRFTINQVGRIMKAPCPSVSH
jgi:hypothetical protein